MGKLIYLASPYTDSSRKIEKQRFLAVRKRAINLIKKGYIVFSPIAQTYDLVKNSELPKTWDYWKNYNKKFIENCDELWVYTLPGWRKSVGVQNEIKIAKELKKVIKYIR